MYCNVKGYELRAQVFYQFQPLCFGRGSFSFDRKRKRTPDLKFYIKVWMEDRVLQTEKFGMPVSR